MMSDTAIAPRIDVPVSDHYEYRATGDEYPCVICGAGCGVEPMWFVHLVSGGVQLAAPGVEEDPSDDMGLYPIGPECLRKHPALKPYAMRNPLRATANNGRYELWDGEETNEFDTTGGRWLLVCTKHSTVANCTTLKQAQAHLPSGDWCEECMAEA